MNVPVVLYSPWAVPQHVKDVSKSTASPVLVSGGLSKGGASLKNFEGLRQGAAALCFRFPSGAHSALGVFWSIVAALVPHPTLFSSFSPVVVTAVLTLQ